MLQKVYTNITFIKLIYLLYYIIDFIQKNDKLYIVELHIDSLFEKRGIKMIEKYIELLSSDTDICNKKDYLIFILISIIIFFISLFFDFLLSSYNIKIAGIFTPIITIVLICCIVILSIKRLHDINYSTYWILSLFFPPVFIYLMLQPSVVIKNKFIKQEKTQEDLKLEILIKKLEEGKLNKEK